MVKQGYKKTEVGVIPEEWDVRTLEKLYNITSSKRVFQSQWKKSGIPFYRAREIAVMSDGKPAPEDLYIDKSLYDLYTRQYGSIKKDDVLITGVGTLGKVYVVKENDQFYFKDGNIIWLQFKDGFSSKYLKHQYDMPVLINQVFGNAGGSTVATYTITNAKATKVPVPPLCEQNRIAEALSDVDSMISSLEKLIAKKKAIKQGAMQELLTGKKRLPGFTGEIEYKSLSSLCEVFADGDWIESKDQSNDGIRLIQTGNIGSGKYLDKTDKQRFISEDTFNRLNCFEIFENDVLVSRLPDPTGRACILPYSIKRRITAVDCTIIRFADYNPMLFVAYSQTKQYQDKVDMAMAGSTRQRISRKELGEIPIPVFPTIEEQNAIASILSDMDTEIEALGQKLEKTRQIKQGMMQQLLTGKIRLVSANADNKPIEAVSKPHHNHQFDDAVMIAAIVNEFYNDTIPLGRKKVQKLLYLLRRKQEADISAFKKKAAGPYADEVRYKGGEPIAIRSHYVLKRQGTKGTTFSKGEKIESALEYIKKWEMTDDINWLISTFKYTKTTDLELFATIDMAMCDLINSGESISVESIKKLIASNKEWKDKLSKAYFSDNDIARAIRFCQCTFN